VLRLGPHQICALETGRFALDGGAMFGVVPRPLWEKRLPPDEHHRVPLALRCLLVRTAGRTVLVDTGMGDKWPDKARAIYALDGARSLLASLAAQGVQPDDVTDVVLTHLHFDHAGGTTRRSAAGAVELTFPRATHHVQRRNWEHAQRPNDRDRGSYLAENFAALEGSGRLDLLDGPGELFPGFHVFLSEGHTPGLQLVRLEGDGRALLYCADLIPTSAHLQPAWGMGYDLQPAVLLEEKKALLARAAAEKSIIVFEHDPRIAACTVRHDGAHAAVDEEIPL
jgi:glyoxylase-like metal-dependent hydrolase (beta-lactamase superfamily II)